MNDSLLKKQWDKHFYSSRHLHREANASWPAFFLQGELNKADDSKLAKVFWKKLLEMEMFCQCMGF